MKRKTNTKPKQQKNSKIDEKINKNSPKICRNISTTRQNLNTEIVMIFFSFFYCKINKI